MDEPGRIRRVLPGEPNCELVVRLVAVDSGDSERFIGVEHKIGIRAITDVSHLSGGSEAAGGVIFADEGKGIIGPRDEGSFRVSIDPAHVDLVLPRGEILDRIHVRPINVARRENTAALIFALMIKRPDESVATGSAGQVVAAFGTPE